MEIVNDAIPLENELSTSIVACNLGLYQGKMGLCLSFFMKGRITKDKKEKALAKKLLDEIGQNINSVEDYSFENGLLGIGWAIEWLAQKGYLKIDTNEVLENLDDEIYKLIMFNRATNISLENGTLGRVLYLYKRVVTKSSPMDFYRETSLYEILNVAFAELYESICVDYLSIRLMDHKEKVQNEVFQVTRMLIKLKPLKFSYLVDDLLNKIGLKLEEFLKDVRTIENIKPYYSCITECQQIALALGNKRWYNEIQDLIRTRNLNIGDMLNNTLKVSSTKEGVFYKLLQLSKLTNDYSWQEGWLMK